jgi:hypothetical protein
VFQKQRIDAPGDNGGVATLDVMITRVTLLYQSGLVTQEVAKRHIDRLNKYWGRGRYVFDDFDLREIETVQLIVESPMPNERYQAALRVMAKREMRREQGLRPRGAPRIRE